MSKSGAGNGASFEGSRKNSERLSRPSGLCCDVVGIGGVRFYDPWGALAMVALDSSGAELQLSGSATDLVLVLTSPRAAGRPLKRKVKLGDDASVAAGPVASTTLKETDVTVRVEILFYSRVPGLLAGISRVGSTLRPDNSANKNLYGQDISAKDIVFNEPVSVQDSAKNLLATLQKASPTKK